MGPLCRGEKILSVLVDVPERRVLVVKDTNDYLLRRMPSKPESDLIVSYLSSLSQVSMPLKKLGSVEEKIRPEKVWAMWANVIQMI